MFTGIGLITVAVGVQAFLSTRNAAFPLACIIGGGVIGEGLRIEDRLESLGEGMRRRFERPAADEPTVRPEGERHRDPPAFVSGFVTASLTFCVGPLTVLGSIQDGVGAGAQLLLVKAGLDGVVAAIYASTFGIGVAASVVTVIVVQGALTFAGAVAGHDLLSARMIAELTATGGVMVLGLGLRLLDLKPVRVGNYLPGLVLAPLAVALFAR
jgi:hypothetical protein